MFDSREENTKAVDSLWAVYADQPRGTVIPWQAIETIIGGPREAGGWTVINRYRKRLRKERQIVTLCHPSVGLRLLTHQEVATEIPQLRQRKAYRQVNRCLREVDTVDCAAISDHQRMVLMQQKHNLAYQRLQIGRSRRDGAKALKKSEVNPIRKVKESAA